MGWHQLSNLIYGGPGRSVSLVDAPIRWPQTNSDGGFERRHLSSTQTGKSGLKRAHDDSAPVPVVRSCCEGKPQTYRPEIGCFEVAEANIHIFGGPPVAGDFPSVEKLGEISNSRSAARACTRAMLACFDMSPSMFTRLAATFFWIYGKGEGKRQDLPLACWLD